MTGRIRQFFILIALSTLEKKVNDSLSDEKAFWPKYVEELDEKKSPWLVNSAAADALVARGRSGVRVSGKLADILSDLLNTMVSVTDGEIVCVKLAMIFSDAGKDENINFVRNLANNWQDSAVLHYYCP